MVNRRVFQFKCNKVIQKQKLFIWVTLNILFLNIDNLSDLFRATSSIWPLFRFYLLLNRLVIVISTSLVHGKLFLSKKVRVTLRLPGILKHILLDVLIQLGQEVDRLPSVHCVGYTEPCLEIVGLQMPLKKCFSIIRIFLTGFSPIEIPTCILMDLRSRKLGPKLYSTTQSSSSWELSTPFHFASSSCSWFRISLSSFDTFISISPESTSQSQKSRNLIPKVLAERLHMNLSAGWSMSRAS